MTNDNKNLIVSNIEEISKNSRGIFMIYVGFISYCGITALSITDEQLIINDKTIFLPLLNTDISVTGFFMGASITSIFLYIYFNLYLFRLKTLMDDLFILDPLYNRKYLYPWLFNFQGGTEFKPIEVVQNFIVNFIRWWSLPIVNLLLILQYVKTHDEDLSVVLGIIPITSVFISLFFWIISEYDSQKKYLEVKNYKLLLRFISWKLLLLAFFVYTTFRYYFVFLPNTLLGQEVLFFGNAIKVSNMVNLSGKTIVRNNINCDGQLLVNFVNSHFEGANLKSSVFKNTDLKGASFVNARLHFTNFECSDLREVNFSNADFFHPNFRKADLRRVKLSNANLEYTNFEDADLYGVNFMKSELSNAKFTGARLKNADLRYSKGLNEIQLCEAYHLQGIKLDKVTFDSVNIKCPKKLKHYDEVFNRKFPFR